ncbi:hypothetical protein BDW02DRAFT_231629 [Decorospora gaudefroyi]|uniref:Nephrocystin 3-like N-terminal domain-containing protein n=1 Tax=Decorospora gaudefroyi TaxID=184978 RepID=A0A6A5KPT3_9PLEO|nr:hypothetical protein BDW02DRAFT_231629 [Decorospora gaudefroyi]
MSSQTETADIAMVDSSLAYPLFDEAIQAIQNTVLEGHRLQFRHDADTSLLLDELRQVSACNGSGDRRIVACSRKFTLFVRAFAPYFDIVSLCVDLRPEWIGWFWGLVRLVFKVSRDHQLFQEKLADMLERVAHIIPPYQQIYEVCKRNSSDSRVKAEEYHLAALMSYVYVDLVQIWLELYLIFCRGPPGTCSRILTLDKTQSALWRPLDSRFSHLETRLAHHRKWLEKETENQIQAYADVAQRRKGYLNFLHRRSEVHSNGHSEQEEHRMSKRLKRVEKVQNWLLGASAVDAGNRSQSQHPKSCVWFLQSTVYCRWKVQPFDRTSANDKDTLENNWQHRVLFVQAKVGFGKTFISYAVTDDLAAEAEDPDLCEEPPATAFFHFNRLCSESSHPENAFRTMACQLLQIHRHDRSTLDAVCLLLRKTSFREHAITDEIMEFLSLLLRQHPTFLVVDGIDECSDIDGFLASLARLCRGSDTRAIVFSRPNLKIPLEYQKWASDAPHILPLTSKHNTAAIGHHVLEDLNRMADQGFFGISMDRRLISQVAQAADGEFLWASMLLKFLQSPVLSSEERVAILQNIQSLTGLESLYLGMLGALARHPQHEKRIITDVFRWLSFPIHRMCSAALRAALSTYSPDVPEGSHATDIIAALPELTCGLIQFTNETISFVHGSIRDYLQSPTSQDSEFSLADESSVHAHLAARCLSYLAHDVPKRPLSGLQPMSPPIVPPSSGASQRTSASVDSGYKSLSSSDGDNHAMPPPHPSPRPNSIRTVPFDTHLPFLRYAALCWPIHLSRALSLSPSPCHHTTTLAYLPALAAFLSSRLALTAWVEASFRYKLPPTLTRLVGPLSDLKGEIPPASVQGKELRLVVGEMRMLSERLVGLKREFEGVLRGNPSLVWQMDERRGGEAYWPVWEDVVRGVGA